ncbi:MAG: FIST C-terminal domain-containing protein [Proteobacteria bacterium]|nr:FIST C-terminal domain-containing protein [Pseudomonadota bacterium]
MRTVSAFSTLSDSVEAARRSAQEVRAKLNGTADLLVVYATEHHARPEMMSALRELMPGSQIIGGTSCGGVMTETGFHASADGSIGVLGIADPDGAYGVGAAGLENGAFNAGASAVERALAAAGRDYETPTLVWCCQPPGEEEGVLAGIQSVIGPRAPIIGGSAADERLEGAWRQFGPDGVLDAHAVVAVLFPSGPYGAAFQSGYAPTDSVGTVTKSDGRRIMEIDGRPAAEVYSGWTDGAVAVHEEGMILAESTPTPLGRLAGEMGGVPMFILSHPALVGAGGDLSLFTEIATGDRVHLMRGSPDSLVKRAGVVVSDACANGGWTPDQTQGGLVIYCGGCMLHVRERMDEVVESVRAAIPGAAFLGAFTFGEQGAIVDNCNRHGNLMISALTFG